MSEPNDIRLEASETNLTELSFAETSVAGLNEWSANLPLANTQETANQLKLATAELALLIAEPKEKFAYLEAIRPLTHYIYSRVDRSQSSKPNKDGDAHAQKLLLNLCAGYKSITLDALTYLNLEKSNNKDVLGSAIHRLVSDLSRLLLSALKHYTNPPTNFWWELNELYRLSEVHDLKAFTLQDDENHRTEPLSIESAYIRALLLETCKPNQLQKSQLVDVFNALESWTGPVNISNPPGDSLLVIDLMSNAGPEYQDLVKDMQAPRGISTEVLAFELEAFLNDVDGELEVPTKLNKRIIRQLSDAWSVMQARTFGRFATNTPVRVAVGLRATHYFLSGGCDFSQQLANTDQLLRREINPFLDVDYEVKANDDPDPWSQAHDLKVRIPINPNIETPESILLAKEQTNQVQYDHFETKALDSSPGGYRLAWQHELPSNASVGELIALREEKADRWCVAVIRWLNRADNQTTMGVELLSPRAIPIAVRAIQKVGGRTDYARGLLLPEISAIGQAASIVTPSVPFEPRQKINLQRQGIEATAKLLESQRKTESFNQFTFRMLDGYLDKSRGDSKIDALSAMTREDTSQGP